MDAVWPPQVRDARPRSLAIAAKDQFAQVYPCLRVATKGRGRVKRANFVVDLLATLGAKAELTVLACIMGGAAVVGADLRQVAALAG
jgi:hypothetical protein